MKKTLLFTLLWMIASLIACKKSTLVNVSQLEEEIPVDSTICYGRLNAMVGKKFNGSLFVNTGGTVFATFSKTVAKTGGQIYPIVYYNAGNVSLNNIVLRFYSSNNSYYDTTYFVPSNPRNWMVSGSTDIPAFTFSCNDPGPVYNGVADLPDTLHFNKPDSIHVTHFTGSKKTSIGLESWSGSVSGYQTLSPGSTSGFFSKSDMLDASASKGYAIINVIFENNELAAFKGKLFYFTNLYVYKKQVAVVP